MALLMALGQALFNSRTVGRIGAALFYFHGTLSFIAFFKSQPSLAAAWATIRGLKDFLPSGYPYRGELWGIWTQIVYLNQRHFASAVGILVIVLLFLIDRYRRALAAQVPSQPPPELASREDDFAPPSFEAPPAEDP